MKDNQNEPIHSSRPMSNFHDAKSFPLSPSRHSFKTVFLVEQHWWFRLLAIQQLRRSCDIADEYLMKHAKQYGSVPVKSSDIR